MIRSLLTGVVSYPRNKYTQDGNNLDLAYITDDIIVMSLPALTFPQNYYRNQLHKVKEFLDSLSRPYKVFEFRAEGAGYPDSAFDGRVQHFPFPDHHPPPFRLLPKIADAMREHLSQPGALAVLHCKAGKGRSGLCACTYLVAHRGWQESEARRNFTERRMRRGFEGVSIPSQQRYLRYVQRWTDDGKKYRDMRIRIDALEVMNLRSGYQLAVRAFAQDGEVIETVHEFSSTAEASVAGSVTKLTPSRDVVITSDVCIYISKGTSWAHFWFNTFFESNPFSIQWHEVDGWKGTRLRANQAYDTLVVHWTALD